jgi:hypothetical protein
MRSDSSPEHHDQRASFRFDKVFEVAISTAELGEISAIARNISSGGMLIETPSPMALGTLVNIRFQIPDSDGSIVAVGEVKHQYVFNFAIDGQLKQARGMGVKFVEFLEDLQEPGRRTRMRTLH